MRLQGYDLVEDNQLGGQMREDCVGEVHPGDKEVLGICKVEHSNEDKRRMGEQSAGDEG